VCIIHSLRKGEYVRSVRLPHKEDTVDMIAFDSGSGYFVVYSKSSLSFYVYSINGNILASRDANEHLRSMLITQDGNHLITGGQKQTVIVRNMYNLEIVSKIKMGAPIYSMTMINDRYFMVGTNCEIFLLYMKFNRSVLGNTIESVSELSIQ